MQLVLKTKSIFSASGKENINLIQNMNLITISNGKSIEMYPSIFIITTYI